MRCLTLADALSHVGVEVMFVAAAMPEALAQRIAAAGHRLERIPASPELRREGREWEEPPLSGEAQLADANATGAAAGPAEWVVVDHYLLDARWHSAARTFAGQILVIDDLANRSHDCEVLLDQTFGRSAEDYRGLVSSGTKVLAGANYALLRSEFARERSAALERRQAGGPVRRILVSMGTGDPGGITARVVEQALAVAPECAIDVVLGLQAQSLERVRDLAGNNPRLAMHVSSERMAGLMREADIAIGAAGMTSWERCCLGLPSIVLVLADNQRLGAESLDRAGAVILADSPDAVADALRSLLDNERMRLSMIAAAAAVTDGNGVGRIVEAMIGPIPKHEGEPTFRPAGPDDSRTAWLWRNDYVTRMFSQTSAPIAWPDHQTWWDKMLDAADRWLLIAEVGDVPVAVVRFDRTDEDEVEVSINLAPSARGSGLGGRILAASCRRFQEQRESATLIATIHCDNPASRRIFEKIGFVQTDALSKLPFERYVLAEGTAE
jgi:UDP-2,4-diacetamido-2,4,6-trideoxy-beta-L-altropyranose hydrolase